MAGRPKGNEKTGQLLNLAIETQQQAMPYNKKSKSGINHRILVHFTPAANIRFARLGIFTSKAIVLHINKGLVSGHTTERARLREK